MAHVNFSEEWMNVARKHGDSVGIVFPVPTGTAKMYLLYVKGAQLSLQL